MAGDSLAQLSKPVMRGLHNATIKRNLIVAGVLCTVVCTAFKFVNNDAKKSDYAEFYKTYDANKVFNRMKDAGLLQCAKD